MKISPRPGSLVLFAFAAIAFGCKSHPPLTEGAASITVKIPDFTNDTIPSQFTCDGSDSSPAISWTDAPPATQSFAVTTVDTDAPNNFVHWVVYDVPAQTHELPESLSKQPSLPDGTRQGRTDFDKIGYGGPCPPGKSPHQYVFTVYAVDSKLTLPANATRAALEEALKGHILAYGQVTAQYTRAQK